MRVNDLYLSHPFACIGTHFVEKKGLLSSKGAEKNMSCHCHAMTLTSPKDLKRIHKVQLSTSAWNTEAHAIS